MLTAYKRCHWFNSDFHSGFLLNDNQKISEISFDVNPFQINVNNNLKVITYVRDSTQSKPIQIKLKEPYNQSREVFNDDNEGFPIIYTNHTGTEAMNNYYPYSVARLIPQQIPRFTFRVDDNYNSFFSSSGTDVIYRIFNYTGSIQTFNVPTGVSSVNVYCWGAGGASGLLNQSGAVNGRGGFGGFVKATLTIPTGTTSFKVIVGQGGRKDNGGSAFGGGGEGFGDSGDWKLGSGGGLSGIFVDNANMTMTGNNINSLATAIIIAGGGGAAGAQNIATADFNDGGNGGSSTGNDGSTSGGAAIATGGSQSAGGTTGGALFTGGSKAGNYQAGGGGGYYGGGRSTPGSGTVAGGGGGSSYLNIGSYTITNITNLKNATNGTLSAPGNTESYYQAGIGTGGITVSNTTASVGGNGLVVIEYFRKRIEGITPEETLIQATNTNIPITIDSQYQINYQTPVVLPKGTYETIFNNGSILFRNKKFPRPWGAYFAEDWSGTILRDSSGNGRHATTAGTIYSSNLSGNGANTPITYLSGTTTSSITWPAGSIPSTFTILTLARWDGINQANYQRIFDGGSGNWFQGHIDVGFPAKQIGGAFYNTWITSDTPTISVVPSITDWVCMIGKNSGSAPNNLLANGIPRAINTGGTSGSPLTINNGTSTVQRSDWAMSCVMIWDTALTDAQMFELNRLVNNYKENGKSLKNELWVSNDYSYPILKDANGANINPLVWYQFDGSTSSLVNDASGNGRTLTASSSSPTFDNTNFIKGNGSALFVSANNQYFSMPRLNYNAINSANGISFSFWCRLTNSTDNNAGIIEFSSYGATNASILILRNALTNNLRFYSEGGTTVDISTSGTNFFDGAWRHITWTVSKTGFWTIYSNATSILTNAGKILPAFTSATNVDYIGSRSDGVTGIDGNIDDFRIYDIELTATQVSELYNGRLAIYNPPGFIIGTEIEAE